MNTARQTLIGLGLGGAIVAGWLTMHVAGVFFWRPSPAGFMAAPLMMAAQSWLGAGLFIVAHDAMHGSLAPGRRRLNAVVGQVCLGLYAAFSFRTLNVAHHAHHRAPGSEADPDFHAERPASFAPWFLKFFRTYFGWREFGAVTAVLALYLFVFHRPPLNCILFWGLPAIGSALQLFVFGTWLPHRHGGAFADGHRARSLNYPWLGSLLTCFHFGYHLEHHLSPRTPWWALPRVRAQGVSAQRAHGAFTPG